MGQAPPTVPGRADRDEVDALAHGARHLHRCAECDERGTLTAQPAPINVGLMKPDNEGRVTAMFPTPADLPQPVAMAVTIEPDGGVPAPTGDKYLVGKVGQ